MTRNSQKMISVSGLRLRYAKTPFAGATLLTSRCRGAYSRPVVFTVAVAHANATTFRVHCQPSQGWHLWLSCPATSRPISSWVGKAHKKTFEIFWTFRNTPRIEPEPSNNQLFPPRLFTKTKKNYVYIQKKTRKNQRKTLQKKKKKLPTSISYSAFLTPLTTWPGRSRRRRRPPPWRQRGRPRRWAPPTTNTWATEEVEVGGFLLRDKWNGQKKNREPIDDKNVHWL